MQTSSAFGRDLNDLSVLVVDDNKQARLTASTLLRSFGCREIREAEDGSHALTTFYQGVPDLIILDWEMHPMNGEFFLLQLRRIGNEPFCFVPVIVLTAHARPALIARAFECGASQFLVKPVTPQSLLDRIQWVLQDNRRFEPAGEIYRQPTPNPSAKPEPKRNITFLG